MARTLFVTDLDGTLLRGDRTLSQFTVRTIRGLIERGILITYATARTFQSAFELTNQIDFRLPVITRNGTVIASQVLKKEIRVHSFETPQIRSLKDLVSGTLERTGFVTAYFDGKLQKTFARHEHSSGMRRYIEEHSRDNQMSEVSDTDALFGGTVSYITMIDSHSALRPLHKKIKDAGDWECNFQKDNYSDDFWLEIFPKNATKAKAALELKAELECDRLVVFGDGLNDISMFEVADESCAVANAEDEVKRAATKIIPCNEDDGVAKYLLEAAESNLD